MAQEWIWGQGAGVNMGAARRCEYGGGAQVWVWVSGRRTGADMGAARRCEYGAARRCGCGCEGGAQMCGCAVAPRVEGLIFVKQTLGKDARIVRVRVFHIVSTASSSFKKKKRFEMPSKIFLTSVIYICLKLLTT